jgi:hypothetical protein
VGLEAFERALLRRPQNAPRLPEETIKRIQRERLAYHPRLRTAAH